MQPLPCASPTSISVSDPAIAKARNSTTQINGHQLAQLLTLGGAASLLGAPGVDAMVFTTRRITTGDRLFRAGDECHSLYVVRFGSFKSLSLDASGTEQVVDFPMRGDVLGIHGIESGRHQTDAVALEASEVAVMPLDVIMHLTRTVPGLERFVFRLLGRELLREQALIHILATLGANARVAAFLLNLSERFGQIGCSRSEFILRMTRRELGSHLGLKLETVSRAFSAFDTAGIIEVSLKHVRICDFVALRRAMEVHAEGPETQPAHSPKASRVAIRQSHLFGAPVPAH